MFLKPRRASFALRSISIVLSSSGLDSCLFFRESIIIIYDTIKHGRICNDSQDPDPEFMKRKLSFANEGRDEIETQNVTQLFSNLPQSGRFQSDQVGKKV